MVIYFYILIKKSYEYDLAYKNSKPLLRSTQLKDQDQYQYNAQTDKYQHVGDFTPFYIVIAICSIIGFSLFILNIALGCCSKYSEYWQDRHTGKYINNILLSLLFKDMNMVKYTNFYI